MTLTARRATPGDEDALVDLAVESLEEMRPGEPYDKRSIRASFQRRAASTAAAVWVVKHDLATVGFLVGEAIPFDHRPGCCTLVRSHCVTRDARNSAASGLLSDEFAAWSRELGAEEMMGLNGLNSEQTAAVRNLLGTRKLGAAIVPH